MKLKPLVFACLRASDRAEKAGNEEAAGLGVVLALLLGVGAILNGEMTLGEEDGHDVPGAVRWPGPQRILQ